MTTNHWNPFLAERSTPLFLTLLAGEHIKVRFEADRMDTDGDTVYLPRNMLPPRDAPTEQVLADCEDYRLLLNGGGIHEIGHIKWTDFSSDADSPMHHRIRNVLEDLRIEQRWIDTMPGTRPYLDGLTRVLRDRHGPMIPPQGAHPAVVLDAYLLTKLYAEERGISELEPDRDAVRASLTALLGSACMVKVDCLLSETLAQPDTDGATHLARRLLAVIDEETQPPPEDEGDGDGNCDSGGGGGGGNRGSAEGEPDPSARHAAGRAILDASDDDVAPDRKEAIQALLEQLGDDAESGGARGVDAAPVHPESAARDRQRGGSGGAAWTLDPHGIDYAQVLASIGTLAYDVRARLEVLTKTTVRHRPRGRRLDPRKLATHKTDPNVFVARKQHRDIDTAVLCLLDRSGSMGFPSTDERLLPIAIARQAMVGACLAVQDVKGVSVAAAAFPSDEADAAYCLPWGGRVDPSSARDFALTADGGTPLAKALWTLGPELMLRREPRKILFLLTDGAPDDLDAAQAAIAELEAFGVELIALGIQTDEVKKLTDKAAVLNELADLGDAVLTTLEATVSQALVA